MQKTAECVVIGAGVMGCSIAYHLARRGVKPLVLDKGGICSGNTRKSGALVRMHYTNAPEARLALYGHGVFQRWGEEIGGTCGFRRAGFLMIVGPDQVDRLQRTVAMLQSIGVNTRAITAADVRTLQPYARTEDIGAAAYEPDSGYADPVATTHAFAAAARRHGATIEEGVAVRSIVSERGQVTAVETSHGTVSTDTVVMAAGPWSPQLLNDLPVKGQRAQIAFFGRAPVSPDPMVYIDAATGVYARPDGDAETLAGIGYVPDLVDDPDRYNEANDAEFVTAAHEKLANRLPPYQDVAYVRGHAGLYDISPDSRCILDEVPDVKRFYIAAGFSGTGFKKSPAIGIGMAELILDGAARTVDIAPFRLARFTDGSPLQSGDEYVFPAGFGHRL